MTEKIILIGACLIFLANVDSLQCQEQGLQKEGMSHP
jgi:hypothetical protein